MSDKKTATTTLLVAIESATPVGSVALFDGERLIGEWLAAPKKGHSSTLLSGLDSLLVATQRDRADISHIAISQGPGSFTGLRVGMAMAKGLAQGLGVPIIAVPTLDAFAWGVRDVATDDCLVSPILDARKDEVYAALFRGGECLIGATVCTPDEWAERLEEQTHNGSTSLPTLLPTLLIGEGARRYSKVWKDRLGGQTIFAEYGRDLPRASFVGALAMLQFKEGDDAGAVWQDELVSLVPVYIRRSEAEETKARRGIRI